MKRMLFPILSFLFIAAPISGMAQNTEINTVPVADGIYMLTGRGGNIGLAVGEDGTFLIDDKYAPLTDAIMAAITEAGGDVPKFVVNTHAHGDHVGGNENFGKAGSVIVAHDNVRENLSAEHVSAFWGRTTPAAPKGALPVVTFNDEIRFHMNGEQVHVLHMARAHTDGDAVIIFENANVVHMGDIYFESGYPFIDTERGGNVNGVIAAADAVLEFTDDDTRIMPGHGKITGKKELKAYRDMLADIRDRVQKLIDEGKTLDEIKAAGPSKKYDERWGQGFVNPDYIATFVYMSLTN